MDSKAAPKYVNDNILAGKRKRYVEFTIDLQETSRTYPNICVPIAATIDYYKNSGIDFKFIHDQERNSYLQHTMFYEPCVVEDLIGVSEINYPLDKVWRFGTAEGVNALVNAFIKTVRESDELGPGVLNSIEWCINETMDNVLQHSAAPYGFIMGQLQKVKKQLSICIFDWGIGIFNSLKPSKHNPLKPIDAITLALQERVTRDDKIGQGNGMWGLSEIIKENHGFVEICSSGASYTYNNNRVETTESGTLNFGLKQGSTLVDFQLSYQTPTNISKALCGHMPTDLWLEERQTEKEEYSVSISELAHGTGTRQSAVKLRNLILNIFREKRQKIIIDFTGINVVSSSFADELLGKIISEYGFMFFVNTFQIIGVSDVATSVINRSIEQRMAQKYYDPDMKESPD